MKRLPLALIVVAPLLADAAPDEDRVLLDVRDLHNDKGTARCGLYASSNDFLKKTAAEAIGPIHSGAARCVFPHLAPGRYAIAAFHDENDNTELDTNFLGIPKEGLAASNDARSRFGPKWKDAAFDFKGGELLLRARMFY